MRQFLLFLPLLAALPLPGQAPADPAPPTGAMFLSVGAAYNHYASPPTYGGLLDFGVQIAQSNFFSISTLVLQPAEATIRSGVGYQIKTSASGNLRIFGTMDGGISATSVPGAITPQSVSLANLGGGLTLRYNLGALFKPLQNIGLMGGFREAAVQGVSVQPEFFLKLNYYLK